VIKRELLLEDIFFSLTNIVKDAIIVTDTHRNIVYWNMAAERIFGYKDSVIMGKSLDKVLPHIILSQDEQGDLKSKKNFFEAIGNNNNGKKIPLEVSVSTWESEKGSFVTLIVRDVADRKSTEEKLKYLSFHDNLTGLYNRSYFDEELQRLDTTRQLPLSIIIGDIDGFKLVNDAFGYKEGDKLLKKLSKVLKDSCRSEDMLARWGGDEFVILLPGTDIQGVYEIIARIEKKSREINSGEIPLNISLGFSTKDKPEQSIDSVIKEAENSMKQKKLLQSKKVSNSIVASIEKRLKEKNPFSIQDSERVKNLAIAFGKTMKLSRTDMENLSMLADFYDIGKVAIKANILKKNSMLAENEWQIMRMHPEIGYRIAKASPKLSQISDAILHHHENWDGSGYPYHISGNRIPLISRIIAVVTAFDVMVHGRNYKKAIGREKALMELKSNARIQFDPRIVSRFIEMMQEKEENLSLFN
jgi:diguanylate cyclase (GGDEF)-like protein/PAS domain S-box-containing protein